MSSVITRKLYTHSSHYLIGTTLLSVLHLASFPVLTRIFSVADYGILGLVTVTLSTVMAISKFGLNNSAVRFYEECKLGKGLYDLAQYYSTFFWGTVAFSSIITLCFLLSVSSIFRCMLDEKVLSLFSFTSVIILLRCSFIILESFIRAEQRTGFYNLVETITGYASIFGSILLVYYFVKGLYGFFTGQVIAVGVALSFLLCKFQRKENLGLRYFSMGLLKKSMRFGLPLMAFEFLNHILTYSDRYFIQYFHGPEILGIYSVGYNLSYYLSNLLTIPLSLAITPVLMDSWINNGEKVTKEFLTSSLRFYLLVLFPVVLGFVAISKELIVFLASSKYGESHKVVPIVVAGLSFFSLTYIFNAGLIIFKKTNVILIAAGLSAIVSVVSNFLVIPKFGLLGAAYVNCASYLVFFAVIVSFSFTYLSFRVPWSSLLTYLLCASAMYVAVRYISTSGQLASLAAKIVMGITTFTILVLAFDGRVRIQVFSSIREGRFVRLFK